MDIVIIANFCLDLSISDNGRFSYLGKLLAESGHQIELITSKYNHLKKTMRGEYLENWPFKITLINEPGYNKNICIKRFYSHFIWGNNVRKYIKKRKKPDVIYCAIPSLTAPYFIAKYCKINKIRFIIDIQDIWPEAFRMVFDIPIISNIVFAPFKWMANSVYKRADEIIAVSQTYVDRALIVNRKRKIGYPVFLGTNLKDFDENVRNNLVSIKPKNELWLGYCGTLGASYDLILVFEALKNIKSKGITPPKFMVMGNGPRIEEFKKKAQGLNVEFTGFLTYPKMCGLLAKCDFVVNPIKHNTAASIINKHADYASAGVPVINTQESQEYRDLIDLYNMGFNCKNGDYLDLSEKLEILINDKTLREEMGRNARECALCKFDRRTTYQEIIRVILGDVKM